ncbi:MAG: hypothetical protein EOP49_11755, partial [Sphingobacteriales bacterium]
MTTIPGSQDHPNLVNVNALIAHIRRYVPLNNDEAAGLAPFFTPVQARKKEFLLREREACRRHYFVSAGCLRLC